MDGLQSLLLAAALYFVPKLWRYLRSKESTYRLNLPEQVWSPEIEPSAEESLERKYNAHEVQVPPIAHHPKTSLPTVEEQGAWQGKVTNNLIVNGVIFAEILQPPRAYRPFRGRLK
jgi:hypothetical protein